MFLTFFRSSAKKHENQMSQEECLEVLRKCVEKSPIPGIQKSTLQNITKVTYTDNDCVHLGKSRIMIKVKTLLSTIEVNNISWASCASDMQS